MSNTPANASSGPTHEKGAREIASITTPSSVSDSPRVHRSVLDHHRTGLYRARNPHKIIATLNSSQPGFRRTEPDDQSSEQHKKYFDDYSQQLLRCEHSLL
jgi:hypothetical protein